MNWTCWFVLVLLGTFCRIDFPFQMERIHQMNVVPDVVPVLHPSLDLQITVKSTPEQLQQTKKRDTRVVPGAYLTVEQVGQRPWLIGVLQLSI